jgi:three-Cys-motif partner protein
MPFDSRDAQTRIKHEVLHDFAGAWAGIIGNGYRVHHLKGVEVSVPLVYVDGYGGMGRYLKDSDSPLPESPIWGSPIIAMQALESAAMRMRAAGMHVQLSAFVAEKDRSNFAELTSNVRESGLRTPVRLLGSTDEARHGFVNLIRGDFRKMVPAVIEWLEDRYALVFIDPYGAGVPLDVVRSFVARQRTDVITLFPFMDVELRGGSVRKPVDERTRTDRSNIMRCATTFGGDSSWERVATATGLSPDQRSSRYQKIYEKLLRDADPTAAVKSILLTLSKMDRPFGHLFLITRDPWGAIRINEVLRKAGVREHYARWGDLFARRRERDDAKGILSLFDAASETAPGVERYSVEPDDVSEQIRRLFPPPAEVTRRRLFHALFDDVFTAGEIDSALTRMEKVGAVEMVGQKNAEQVLRFRAIY